MLLYSIDVLHPVAFNAGPRVTRSDFVLVNGQKYRVDIWTENGKVVKIGAPVKVN